jgi:D-glycero-D-manno-heptose 1,7-bisphosphate phosphatase
LDRDGVINQAIVRDGRPYPPSCLDELRILPGVRETLAAFRAAGLRIIVVTNQPDVARGIQKRDVVEEMNRQLRRELCYDAVKVCFHTDEDGCACRKPKPGMLVEAAREWDLDLRASFLVGDRWRDIAAGRAVGCRTFWIDRGYRERPAESPDWTVKSLPEAGHLILSEAAMPARTEGAGA